MGELVSLYSEERRDQIEAQLAAEAQKPEIHYERRHNLVIQVYWLKLTNEISLVLIDDAQQPPFSQETLVPNGEVRDAIDHPTLRFPKQNGENQ